MAIDLAVDVDWFGLPQVINPLVSFLCVQPMVSADHSGEQFSLLLGWNAPTQYPAIIWSGIPQAGFPADSAVPPISFAYQASAYDSAEDALHLSSFNAMLRHDLAGAVTVSGMTVTVVIDVTTYLEINCHLLGQDAASSSANVVQRSWTTPYLVQQEGGETTLEIVPAAQAETTDTSGMIEFSVLLFLTNLPSLVEAVQGGVPPFPGELILDVEDAFQSQLFP